MTTRFPIRWLTAPAAAAVVAAVLLVHPGEGAASGAPADSGWEADPDEAAADRDLDARHRVVADRIAYKDALVLGLVAGDLDLARAAAEFLRLNRGSAVCLAAVRAQFPGRTDDEKSARNVIEYVRIRHLPADQKARALARLDGEFAARFGSPPAASR